MGKEGTLRFLIRNIQLFADEEQDDYGLVLEDEVMDDDNKQDDPETQPEKKDGGEPKQAEEGANAPQSRSENAKFAQMRREAEAKEKAVNKPKTEQEAELQGYIKGSGGVNTFTGLPIEDEEDVHLFELMKEADAKGEDPVKEGYRLAREERLKAKRETEEAEKQAKAAEERKKQSTQVAKDNISALTKAHPECDTKWFKRQWEKGGKFKDLVLHGYTPVEAYEFLGMGSKQGSGAGDASSTPSLTSSGDSNGKKSIMQMTDDEWEKYAIGKWGSL